MAVQCGRLARSLGCITTRNCPFLAKDSVKITACILANVISRRDYSSVQPKPRSARIFSAVCVQRLPVITTEKSELEKRYEELQHQLEFEQSALSEDEVQLHKILERKRKLKDDDDDESNVIAISESQRKEFEEEQDEEWRKYEPGNRETEADKLDNMQSLHRKLQETLILLVRRGKDAATWELPHAEVTDTSDTLQQVASRSLSETCGADLKVLFLSNAPIAVMKKYKDTSNKGSSVVLRVIQAGLQAL
ncbi:39S ribosomal protein L46, mitochondrial [Desmophyllum pertusum]|uniref:39S ribosomal protein L46, mitochondrial n=1 Tax=Desmophyllum pertusum TaxID=174260 RepID=A0A9W9YY09_9CNID|nr:39S ribosomal protein L46, mitochondrial [Desmophyllum pertusum]